MDQMGIVPMYLDDYNDDEDDDKSPVYKSKGYFVWIFSPVYTSPFCCNMVIKEDHLEEA